MSAQHPTTTSRDNAMQSNTQKRSGRTTADTIPFAQRLTCTIPEACKATGLGRTKLYELIGGGYLDTITIGRRRLVRVTSLLSIVAPAGAHSEV
jgi:excisionase family DNA binding protein